MVDDNDTGEDHFTDNMRAARVARNWSQSQLADELTVRGVGSMTHATISRIESGKRRVGLAEARAIADLFNTTIDALSGPEEDFLEVLHWNNAIALYNGTRELLLDSTSRYEFARRFLKRKLSKPPSAVTAGEVEQLREQVEDSSVDLVSSEEARRRIAEYRGGSTGDMG